MSYFKNYRASLPLKRGFKRTCKFLRVDDVADGDLITKQTRVEVHDFVKDGTHLDSFRDLSLAATVASGAIDKMQHTSMDNFNIDSISAAFDSLPRPNVQVNSDGDE